MTRCGFSSVVVVAAMLWIPTLVAAQQDTSADVIFDRHPSARYLQSDPVLEVGFAYRGGVGRHRQLCTDDPGNNALNGGCTGAQPRWMEEALGLPAAIDGQLLLFPSASVGLGVRFDMAVPANSQIPATHAPMGPTWNLLVGPALRGRNAVSTAAKGVRFEMVPGLLVRHGLTSPLAGNFSSADPWTFLNAGTYGWTLPGLGVWLELAAAERSGACMRIGANAGVTLPANTTVATFAEPVATVEIVPEVIGLRGAHVGWHLGPSFVVAGGKAAIEPGIHVQWQRSWIDYPDPSDLSNTWTAGSDGVSAGSPDARKVYSTVDGLLSIYFQVGIRFGAGGKV